jgi:hypothetical protein
MKSQNLENKSSLQKSRRQQRTVNLLESHNFLIKTTSNMNENQTLENEPSHSTVMAGVCVSLVCSKQSIGEVAHQDQIKQQDSPPFSFVSASPSEENDEGNLVAHFATQKLKGLHDTALNFSSQPLSSQKKGTILLHLVSVLVLCL